MPEIVIYPKFPLVKSEFEQSETTCNRSKLIENFVEKSKEFCGIPDKCTNCPKLTACILADMIGI